MGTNVIIADRKQALEKEKRILSLELAEIKEISEIMLKKLEMKIQIVQALEASVDKKKAEVEQLLQRAKALETNVLANEEFSSALDSKKNDLETLTQRASALDKKVKDSENLALTLDKKISVLHRLSLQSEALKPQGSAVGRNQEIVALSRKSLSSREIAEVLNMPLGEVELILEISPRQAQG